MQCPFSISFSIFLLQNFKFACCLGRFHLRIALNLLKYALFGHTAHMSCLICPAHVLSWLDCDISVMWTFVWLFFFNFCIGICLALIKEVNSFLYLKLDVLYSWYVEWYQPSTNYRKNSPRKIKIKWPPPNLCRSRDFRLEVHKLAFICWNKKWNILELK